MADDKRLSSILDTTKKKLGLIPDVTTEFDSDIIDCINTALNSIWNRTWRMFCERGERRNLARLFGRR